MSTFVGYTPEPWRVIYSDGALYVESDLRRAEDHEEIACVLLEREEDRANANLLAAAPRLLSHCHSLVAVLHAVESDLRKEGKVQVSTREAVQLALQCFGGLA